MKVSKGQSRPEIVAAAFLILYMVLGSPFLYQVLIVTPVVEVQGCCSAFGLQDRPRADSWSVARHCLGWMGAALEDPGQRYAPWRFGAVSLREPKLFPPPPPEKSQKKSYDPRPKTPPRIPRKIYMTLPPKKMKKKDKKKKTKMKKTKQRGFGGKKEEQTAFPTLGRSALSSISRRLPPPEVQRGPRELPAEPASGVLRRAAKEKTPPLLHVAKGC